METMNVSMSFQVFSRTRSASDMFMKGDKISSYSDATGTLTHYTLHGNTAKERSKIAIMKLLLPKRHIVKDYQRVPMAPVSRAQDRKIEARPRYRSVNKKWDRYTRSQNLGWIYHDE